MPVNDFDLNTIIQIATNNVYEEKIIDNTLVRKRNKNKLAQLYNHMQKRHVLFHLNKWL